MFWNKNPHTVCLPGIRIHHWKITPNILQKKNISWSPSRTGSSRFLACASWVCAWGRRLCGSSGLDTGWRKSLPDTAKLRKDQGIWGVQMNSPPVRSHLRWSMCAVSIGQGWADFHMNSWDKFPCKQDIRFIFALQ